MKLALITDTHFGVRGDNQTILDHQKQFFETQFFPEIQNRNITTVIHLGDLVDRRKYINYHTAERLRKDFLDPVNSIAKMHIIAGNHDVFFKTNNETNAFNEILRGYENIKHYTETTETEFGLFVPWITDSNRNQTLELIEDSYSRYLFGHLELKGFEMFRGSICDHGYSKDLFSRFDFVFSGHFHKKSTRDNIYYLGAPYEMTWSDFNCPRGFHIFDTETQELEFIQNTNNLFERIEYDDEYVAISTIDKKPIGNCANKYVKIVVVTKSDPYKFDMFVDSIEKQMPIDLKIVDSFEFDSSVTDIVSEAQDTQTILLNTIESLELNLDKTKLKQLMSSLYNEALHVEIDS